MKFLSPLIHSYVDSKGVKNFIFALGTQHMYIPSGVVAEELVESLSL